MPSTLYIVIFVCTMLVVLTLLHRYLLEKFDGVSGSGIYDEGLCECCKCGMMKCTECKERTEECECTFKMDRYSYQN